MKNANIRRPALLLIASLLLFTCINAQNLPVKGLVSDSASAKPIVGATLTFLNPGAKTTTTVITDKSGGFQSNLPGGGYKVTITHTGYRNKVMHLAVMGQPVDMGSIQIVNTVKSLSGVTVTAQKPMVEQQADKIIYNVEDDPAAKSETATDLLRKTPYVSVDGDGVIQVNGQTNFKVLLNGRETALFSQNVKEALKGFPGATISKIEVITSPSAKYDAEGVGGIINIITKKKLAGYNGNINSSVNSIGSTSAGFNINVKTGKLGISGVYSIFSNGGQHSNQLSVTTPGNRVPFITRAVDGGRETDVLFQQGNLELSYDVDSFHTLVVYGNLGRLRNDGITDNTITTLFPGGGSDLSPYYVESNLRLPTHGFGSDFIKKYRGRPQKELSFRFNALYNRNRAFNNSLQGIGSLERFLLSTSNAFNNEYTGQVDFVNPINKTVRLETGVKTIFRHAFSDFETLVKYDETKPYQPDPANTNKFSYNQDVYGGYATINKTFKKLTARVGLRVEHTRVHGDFTSTNTVVRQVYTNFIPNLLLIKQLSKTINMNFNYTLRLGRPSINMLNPFVNNTDSLFRSYGNPDLGAQYLHSMSWQTRFFKGNKFISVQAGFNFSNNLIIQSPTFDASTGITSITGANAGQIREFVLGFVSNLPIGKKWNISVNATGRLAHARNSLQTDFTNFTAGNVNGNFTYKATKLFTISSNVGYFMPLRTPNTSFPDNYFYSLSFAQKLFKEKMTLTANASNFFQDDRTLKFVTENPNFITENFNTVPWRNIGLSLTYNFGKLKENVSKKKGVTNDDAVQ